MLSKAEVKRLRSLTRPRVRRESGLFLLEGVRLVEDLLASPVVPRMAVMAPSLEDTPRGADLARRLRAAVETTIEVPEHQLHAVTGTETPQGVLVTAEIPHFELAGLLPAQRSLVVLLDAVQDPGNFGSIVRSADAFGAACVIALPGTVDPWNAKAVRAAAGSSLRVPIAEATVDEAVTHLRQHDFRLLGADMAGDAVDTVARAPRTALALGNEGAGLSARLEQLLDGTVAVPIRGSAESLNVGVAAGILLYSLSREIRT
jgi:RNA methyltransferase, TrmH family